MSYILNDLGPFPHHVLLNVIQMHFRMVNAISFVLSTRHTIPFLCVNTYFGVLHKHSADVMRSDAPWGSKPPQLQVGAFKLHQVRCIHVGRGVLSLMMYSVR